MTAAEAVRLATARGIRFGIEGGILTAYGDLAVIDELFPMLKPHEYDIRAAILEHAEALSVSDVAVAAARLLHLGTWPPTNPVDCEFHCGAPGATCGRCGAAWAAHNGIASNQRAKPKTQSA